jgi:hypothetical protein
VIARVARGLALSAAVTPLLAACVIYDSEAGETVVVRVGGASEAVSLGSETLRAVRFEGGALVVRADSNGCTAAADFAVAISEGDVTDITLTRQSPDLCKALVPDGVELRWTYAELGLEAGDAVRVTNPVRL